MQDSVNNAILSTQDAALIDTGQETALLWLHAGSGIVIALACLAVGWLFIAHARNDSTQATNAKLASYLAGVLIATTGVIQLPALWLTGYSNLLILGSLKLFVALLGLGAVLLYGRSRKAHASQTLTANEEINQLQRELARNKAEHESIVSITAHDLTEPLNGMQAYAGFLLEDHGAQLGDDGRNKLETLVRLSRRLQAMVDALLSYSRASQAEMVVAPVNLNEVVAQELAALADTSTRQPAEIVVSPLPATSSDVVWAAKVFRELILNAAVFSDQSDTKIEIGVVEPALSGASVFYVRDNGIGIDKRHHEAVFTLFRRLHGRDAYGGGCGAGLAITKKILERLGGRIWVESQPGHGSTFYFTLQGVTK